MVKRFLNNIDNLFLAGLLFAALPVLLLSFFTHPQNDDYAHAMYTRSFGLWGGAVRWYYVWTGRYFSCFVLGANPLIFGSFTAYKIVIAVFILIMILSLYYFISELTSRKWSIKHRFIAALTVFVLYLSQMPGIAEGIYWMAGSLTNLGGVVMMLFLFGLLIRINRTPPGKLRFLFISLAVFLIFAISGTHELAMIYTFVILTTMVIIHVIKNHRLNPLWTFFTGVSFLCSLVVILAPGTKVRSHLQTLPVDYLWTSLSSTVLHGSTDFALWLFKSPLLLIAALIIPFIVRMSKERTSPVIHPLLSVPLFLALFFGSYFTSYQGVGVMEARTLNGIYLLFVIGFFFNVYNTVVYLTVRAGKKPPDPPWYVVTALSVLVLLIFPVTDSNVKTAYADLLDGTAYRYDQELYARYAAIEACPHYVCEVEPLRNRPKTIFWFDNAIDKKTDMNSEFWLGYKKTYAAYFNKYVIILKSGP